MVLHREGGVWRFHSGRGSYAGDVCERIKKDSARDRAIGRGGYLLEMYVVALHCSMSSGLYHYQVRDNALECLRQGDCTQLLLEMIQAEPYVDLASSSVVLFITGCVERQMIKYGERAYRFMQNEVGSVTQMVTLIAEALEYLHLVVWFFCILLTIKTLR